MFETKINQDFFLVFLLMKINKIKITYQKKKKKKKKKKSNNNLITIGYYFNKLKEEFWK